MLIKWLHLLAGLCLVLAWSRRKVWVATSLDGLFTWRPIWRQREDFSRAGWYLWLVGWLMLSVWIVATFVIGR